MLKLKPVEKLAQCYELPLQIRGDERGSLISIEEMVTVPFPIKRVYYIFGTTTGVVRGKHAHRELRQVLIAVSGHFKIRVTDGAIEEIHHMNSPDTGLYIGQNLWREMFDFSPDCVLLVLADNHYNEAEYIRDYDTFLAHVGK